MAAVKSGLRPTTVKVENLVYVNSATTELTEASDAQSLQAKSFQTDNYELTDDLLGRLSNLDIQPDVLAEQVDATLSPSLTDGARYMLSNISALHAGFGTITKLFDGTTATLATGDIVQYVAASSEFRIDYNVTARGPGAICWDRAYANFKKWDGTVWTAATSGDLASAKLGLPPDGTYTDGLFSFDATTTPAKAVDDLNEALKYLAPAQGYTLDIMGAYTGLPSLFSQKLTGDSTGPLTGSTYESTDANGAVRSDVINGTGFTLQTPDIADKTGAINVGFRSADQGTLTLEVNASVVGSLSLLPLFDENNRATGQTITAGHTATGGRLKVTSVQPTNGFPLWQDGTAQIVLANADLRLGYNTVQLKHTVDGVTKASVFRKFWYSPAGTLPVASGVALGAIASPTTRNLSGVQYYSGGSYAASASVDNPYARTFHANALSFSSAVLSVPGVTTPNPTLSAGAVTNIPWALSSQACTILGNKRVILSSQLQLTATPLNNYGSAGTAGTASVSNILIDSYTPEAASALTLAFQGEAHRVASNANFNSTAVAPNWTSTQSIANAGAAGYNDGLLVYNGGLYYPSQNFSTITAPQAGPNYSGSTGRRYLYLVFQTGSTSYQNFHVTLTGITASLLSATTGSGIFVEMALPTQTSSTSSSAGFEFKDCMRAYTTDTAIGCQNGAAPSGSNPTINFTSGTKGTANSGFKLVLKISYPQGSSAVITGLTVILG